MAMKFDTNERSRPTCPGCGYALDDDDMNSDFGDNDLWALAPSENKTSVTCPCCDTSYWVQGGYNPHYTSAFAEEDL